jgi:Flp pilus assembly protein TadG
MSFSFTGSAMSFARHIPRSFRRMGRCDEGAALVEFAIILPMMLLVFAIIIEGSRMLLSYQAAISGVRDAARYLSRVVPTDICTTGGSVSGHDPTLLSIVGNSTSGGSIMPSAVTVNSVTSSLACIAGTYRVNPAPVATVTASISISFPFSGLFTLTGNSLSQITTSITDRSRIFGT